MVHEFGHFSNLAHTQTNGGILLGIAVGTPETSGPAPFNTFGAPTVADFANNGLLETMYPFFFGRQFGDGKPGARRRDVDLAPVSRADLLRHDRQRRREHFQPQRHHPALGRQRHRAQRRQPVPRRGLGAVRRFHR